MMCDSGIEKENQMVKDESHNIYLASTISFLFLPPQPSPNPRKKILAKHTLFELLRFQHISFRTGDHSTFFTRKGTAHLGGCYDTDEAKLEDIFVTDFDEAPQNGGRV